MHSVYLFRYDYSSDYYSSDYNTANGSSPSTTGDTSSPVGPPPITKKEDLRRTNSASSVLGLNVLLHQNHDEYWRPPEWKGVVKDTFVGFKVLNTNQIWKK